MRRGIIVIGLLLLSTLLSFAHDKRYAVTPQLKQWFDTLRSAKGPCCSDADGTALSDVDWESKDGKYRVRIEGEWYDVPDDAVLRQPNLYGPTMVWPMFERSYMGMGPITKVTIRCFIPGVMT